VLSSSFSLFYLTFSLFPSLLFFSFSYSSTLVNLLFCMSPLLDLPYFISLHLFFSHLSFSASLLSFNTPCLIPPLLFFSTIHVSVSCSISLVSCFSFHCPLSSPLIPPFHLFLFPTYSSSALISLHPILFLFSAYSSSPHIPLPLLLFFFPAYYSSSAFIRLPRLFLLPAYSSSLFIPLPHLFLFPTYSSSPLIPLPRLFLFPAYSSFPPIIPLPRYSSSPLIHLPHLFLFPTYSSSPLIPLPRLFLFPIYSSSPLIPLPRIFIFPVYSSSLLIIPLPRLFLFPAYSSSPLIPISIALHLFPFHLAFSSILFSSLLSFNTS
jgi:hypothetical protein